MKIEEENKLVVAKGDVLVVTRYSDTDILGSARLGRVLDVLRDRVRIAYEIESGVASSDQIITKQVTNDGRNGWLETRFEEADGEMVEIRGANRWDMMGFKLRNRGWSAF